MLGAERAQVRQGGSTAMTNKMTAQPGAARPALLHNLAANYLGRAWEAAMSVAFVPLYIHYLGPEAYGVIGMVALIQSFLLVLDFGMTPALTREAARFAAGEHSAAYLRDLLRSVEMVVAALTVVVVGAIALAAPTIAEHWIRARELDSGLITRALVVGGALIAMRFFESVFRGTLQGLERQVLSNAIGAGFATLRGAGAVALLAWGGAGLTGFLAWQALAAFGAVLAMRAGVAATLGRPMQAPRFSRVALASIGRFAGGMFTISILALAASQADKFVLSRLLPLADFGYYVFAANLAVILELMVTPVMTALYPRVVALVAQGDEAGLARLFHRWARIVAAMTGAVAAWLVFFAPQIILAWSGNPELAQRSGPLLSIIAIGTLLHAQCALPYYLQLAKGWTRLSVWVNGLALGITVPMLLLATPRLGAAAGAWTWVGVATLYLLVGVNAMFGRILPKERWRFFLADLAPPIGAAFAVMAGAASLFAMLDPQDWLMRAMALALGLGTALAASAGAAWLAIRAVR